MSETTPYLTLGEGRARRQPLVVIALSMAVAALLVAAGLSLTALGGGGSATPEDAVRGLLNAAGSADVIGVLDHLDPAERDAIAGAVEGSISELKRLGVLSSAADPHHVPGVSASFTGLALAHDNLRDDVAAVHITGGQVVTNVDPANLPIGSFLKTVLGPALANKTPSSHTSAIKLSFPIGTVRRDGGWYVSIGFTVAEAARQAAHLDLPAASAAVPAVGADSATHAVHAFLQAIAALDARRLVELTPPDEMAALHEYAPLFLDKAARAASDPAAPKITISDLELSSEAHPGGELVHINKIAVHVVSGQSTYSYSTKSHCLDVVGPSAPPIPTCAGLPSTPSGSPGPFDALQGIKIHLHLGVVAVERDDKWYVSPLRTVLDSIEAVLQSLPTDAMERIRAAFDAGLGGLLLGPLGSFGALGGLGNITAGRPFVPAGGSIGSGSGPAPIGTMIHGVSGVGASPVEAPSLGPCRGGVRAVTFPQTSSTFTIPCGQP